MKIEKVAIIGSGVMGAGIATHLANAGVEVLLYDIVPKGATDRDVVAKGAIEKALKANPAAFMHRSFARRVSPANLEDHLGRLAEVDWIIEVIVEKLEVKQELYRKLDGARRPGSIVSSNTSTIALHRLMDGMPANLTRDFLITHFFNPPRYMRLLEFVVGPDTRADAVAGLRDFCDRRLGKTVVDCRDTPGFIGNRVGSYWISSAIKAALDQGITVEEADAVIGRPFGFPKTGVFGLMDLVGLDLAPLVGRSLSANLPNQDDYHRVRTEPPLFARMIEEGYTGRKGKGGFYRMRRDGDARIKEAIDLKTGQYRASEKAQLESVSAGRKSPRKLLEHPDKGGQYAWRVLSETLAYAAARVPEISPDIVAVDDAMKLGYGWKQGPFELIDKIGAAWFAEKLAAEGREVPALLKLGADKGGFYKVEGGRLLYLTVDGAYTPIVRPEGVLVLADVKRAGKPVAKNGSASLWDIGDGVLCLEFHSKMNALDPDSLALLSRAIAVTPRQHKALVIYNEADNFSVGANIGLGLFAANIAAWSVIETTEKTGQDVYKQLKYAKFPSVAAPAGMALGGGCEVCLHASAIQANAETYIGLVEAGVGVVPGWGGCKELLLRAANDPKGPKGPMAPVARAFRTIATAEVSRSAFDARDLLYLRGTDGITMNRDRLLADAKARALELAKDYKPPVPAEIALPGPSGRAGLQLSIDDFALAGKITAHDQVVAGQLADVLSGGDADHTKPVGEEELLALERKAFMALIRTPATLARIEHMLETGKPLRN
jgi:3-hydroxyacyl-CoA dehydrogenase